jgi:hypothetical protein
MKCVFWPWSALFWNQCFTLGESSAPKGDEKRLPEALSGWAQGNDVQRCLGMVALAPLTDVFSEIAMRCVRASAPARQWSIRMASPRTVACCCTNQS